MASAEVPITANIAQERTHACNAKGGSGRACAATRTHLQDLLVCQEIAEQPLLHWVVDFWLSVCGKGQNASVQDNFSERAMRTRFIAVPSTDLSPGNITQLPVRASAPA